MIELVVHGTPQPAGSKKAFAIHRGTGKDRRPTGQVSVSDANPQAAGWKQQVAQAAELAISRPGRHAGPQPMSRPPFKTGAVVVDVVFYRQRPKGHWTTRGELSAEGRRHPFPDTKPDRGKLLRAVEDALESVLYSHDAQIVGGNVWKRWGTPERVVAWIYEAGDKQETMRAYLAQVDEGERAERFAAAGRESAQ